MTDTIIFEGDVHLDEEVTFEFSLPKTNFRFNAELVYGNHVAKVVSLFRFNLVDSEGRPVSHLSAIDAYGLSRSSDPSAGFFKYVHSKPGNVSASGEIELPFGVYCQSISLVRWGSKSADVDISLRKILISD